MVLSEDPLTTSRSLYWRHAMPRLCPFRVRTNSHVLVLQTCETQDNRSSENYAQTRFLNFNRSRYEFINRRGLRLTFAGQWNENSHSIFTGKEWVPGVTGRPALWGPSGDKSHGHCCCTSNQWEKSGGLYIKYFQVVKTAPNDFKNLITLESW